MMGNTQSSNYKTLITLNTRITLALAKEFYGQIHQASTVKR